MGRRSTTRLIGSLVGVGGVAFSLTLLSRSMRSVQSIGGVCRSGASATLITHPCPAGVAGLLPLSIFGGLGFLFLFAVCAGETGRPLTLLAWPALFLSLGWNFLDYGLGLTTGNSVSGGFLVCGVLFIVMGGVPLIWLVPMLWRVITGGPDPDDAPGTPGQVPFMGATSVRFNQPSSTSTPGWGTGTTVRVDSPPATATATPTAPATPSSTGEGLAGELERLASLHRRRELTDAEYEAAKSKAIANTESPT